MLLAKYRKVNNGLLTLKVQLLRFIEISKLFDVKSILIQILTFRK